MRFARFFFAGAARFRTAVIFHRFPGRAPRHESRSFFAVFFEGHCHAIGYETAHGKLPDNAPTGKFAKLDELYVNPARDVAGQRVVMAGYRLADLINGLFPPAAPRGVSPWNTLARSTGFNRRH